MAQVHVGLSFSRYSKCVTVDSFLWQLRGGPKDDPIDTIKLFHL